MTTASPTPGEPAGLNALAALAWREHRAGRLAEAAAAYRKILALQPDAAEMCNNLGDVLLDQEKLDEALAQYERAVALKPSLFQAHNNLGSILWKQGKLDQAVARYEQALALRGDLAETHNKLGCIFRLQNKRDYAATQFEQAIALKPDFAEAHNNLGNIFWEQGKLDQGVARLAQAIALRPDLAEAHNNLGLIFRLQDNPDQAVASFARALAINPRYADAHKNLGTALRDQGKLDEAAAHYETAITLRPDFAEAHYHRADLKKFRAGDPDLAALEALAADPGRLPPGKMLYIHFALGKALEDIGEYGRAFEHFLQGNALKRREVPYHEAAYQRTFQAIAERFDESLLDRLRAVGASSPAPIFIVGMPRSGSTLVEQILASHPMVQAAGELINLNRVVQALSDPEIGGPVPYPSRHWVPDADGLRRLGEAYLASLPPLPDGKTRITDKAPSNFFHVGLIHLILPNARIIHTVRNPVDTCISCFSKPFVQGQAFSYDLAELGCFYRWYYELMDHWRSILPAGAMLDVEYEQVVDNLEEQARRLIDYCGLPWDDRCLDFHKTSRPIKTASSVQVRQPVYRTSVERWRRYEAYLEPLLVELESCRGGE